MSQFYTYNKDDKIAIKNAEIYPENGKWYMTVSYIIENEREIKELYIPKINIPIEKPDIVSSVSPSVKAPSLKFVIESSWLNICDYYDEDAQATYLYRTTLIKEKRVPMTLSEIEKKLGHKIVIVNGHEEKEK